MSVITSPREWNMLLFRSCDLSVPAQHTWTCKLAGACLLATCPYYVVPIPKVYVYVLFLLLIHVAAWLQSNAASRTSDGNSSGHT